MISVSVVGGAGYVGGELIRLLLRHPELEIECVQSESQAGTSIARVHRDLTGSTDLQFSAEVLDSDVLFLCSGHGMSIQYLEKHPPSPETLVIDLSADFRIRDTKNEFIYGLCELNRDEIRKSKRIANCGCFASCIELGLLPLAAHGLLQEDIHVTAITGSTGAGQQPMSTTHSSWRNNNISVYKAFEHQHLAEILQSLRQLQQGFSRDLNFIPMRGDFTRGIFASIYMKNCAENSDLYRIYTDFYKDSAFVHLSDLPLSVKDVVNTNNNLIYLEQHGDYLRIESVLDNLLKGAAGQAVQNMNIALGFPETTGLLLKASAF